ncbi:MAG: polymorphic toxin-type HINT domain-containing protein [Mangrovibacterium sp.]
MPHPVEVEGLYVTDKGWTIVKELKSGDKLSTARSDLEKVEFIQSIKRRETVYNIEVGGNHNYFVTESNILVHNK